MGGEYGSVSEGGAGSLGRGYGSEFGSSAQRSLKFRRLSGAEWQCTNMKGRYSKFFDAMKACASDSSCQGIYDYGCKSKRSKYNLDLQLCTALANSADSATSCIYQKIQESTNVGITRMGGGNGNDEEAFGGYSIG